VGDTQVKGRGNCPAVFPPLGGGKGRGNVKQKKQERGGGERPQVAGGRGEGDKRGPIAAQNFYHVITDSL